MKKITAIVILALSVLTLSAQNVGIGTASPKSKLDINGGLTVGTDYSGVKGAPTNGAIIEGSVGIGNSSPGALLDLGLAGTTAGVLRLAGSTSGNVTIQTQATAGSYSISLPAAAPSSTLALYMTSGGILQFTGPTTGADGYWTRSGTTLSPATSGDAITTTGAISTTSSGTITSSGLLTGSAGATITGTTSVTNSGTTVGSIGTYPLAIQKSGSTDLTLGSDGTNAYIQSWNSKPLLINNQGNAINFSNSGSTVTIANLSGTNPRLMFADAGGTLRATKTGPKSVWSYSSGSTTTWVVPAGVYSITVYLWGAGGGASYCSHDCGGGGTGGYVSGELIVLPTETLTVVSGAGGCGNCNNGGGNGGGGSAIYRSGSTMLAAAGGGGGGSYAHDYDAGESGGWALGTSINGTTGSNTNSLIPGGNNYIGYLMGNIISKGYGAVGDQSSGGCCTHAPYGTEETAYSYGSNIGVGAEASDGGSGGNGMVVIFY